MTFRVYPDVIDNSSAVSYAAANAIMSIRVELAKNEPDPGTLSRLLNGAKYDQPIGG